MTVLKFTGMVEWAEAPDVVSWNDKNGDDTELADAYMVWRPYIGGVDVIRRIARQRWERPVTVAIAGESFQADEIVADTGSPTYSELTPGDPARLFLAAPGRHHDIVGRLRDGESLTMWVADEPIDLMIEPEPSE